MSKRIFGLGICFVVFISCLNTKKLDSVIYKDTSHIKVDSLAIFRIEKTNNGFEAFIDDKYFNMDFWNKELSNACSKRRNDSIFLLHVTKDVPQGLIYEVLSVANDLNKKVIIRSE
jgi:hypothetical protein